MPIFEYICKQCDHRFEAISRNHQTPSCPSCASRDLDQQLSSFAVGSSQKSFASPAAGPCGSCGDPRGPGSCSMN
jgi:putative FmdB family regulatory protein